MPHDKRGQELRGGDFVMVRAKVKAVHLTETECNVDLIVCDDESSSGRYLPEFTMNSALTERVKASRSVRRNDGETLDRIRRVTAPAAKEGGETDG